MATSLTETGGSGPGCIGRYCVVALDRRLDQAVGAVGGEEHLVGHREPDLVELAVCFRRRWHITIRNSGGLFSAVIVTADGQAFDGVNRVTATNDPTAHAEATASAAPASIWAG